MTPTDTQLYFIHATDPAALGDHAHEPYSEPVACRVIRELQERTPGVAFWLEALA